MEELRKLSTPKPGERFTERVIDEKDKSKKVQAIVAVVPPEAAHLEYHYHTENETLILVLSGEGKEIVEGKEYPVKANDIIYVPAQEKHTIQNTGKTDLKYLEVIIRTNIAAPRDWVTV